MKPCDSNIQKSLIPKTSKDDDVSRKIGIIFRSARNRKSLSQISLSEAANINSSYYCLILKSASR